MCTYSYGPLTFTYLPSPLHWHPLCVQGTTELFSSLSTALSRKHCERIIYRISADSICTVYSLTSAKMMVELHSMHVTCFEL